MAKNTRYNSVGAGVTPKLGHKSFEKGLARPGARASIAGEGGSPLGQPTRPGTQGRGARPAKPSKSGGMAPRAARPGTGKNSVNRKPQARPVPVGQRVR